MIRSDHLFCSGSLCLFSPIRRFSLRVHVEDPQAGAPWRPTWGMRYENADKGPSPCLAVNTRTASKSDTVSEGPASGGPASEGPVSEGLHCDSHRFTCL